MPPPIPPKPSLDESIYSNYAGSRKSAPEFRRSVHADLPPLIRHSAPVDGPIYGNWDSPGLKEENPYDTVQEGSPKCSGSRRSSEDTFVYEEAQSGQSILGQSILEDRPPIVSQDVFFDGQKIFGLDEDNFHTFVKFKDLAMIMFYDPLDPRTDAPKEHFKKAARRQDSDEFAAVDCQRYSDLCKSLGVNTLPIFKVYSMGRVLGTIRETSMFDDNSMLQHLDMINDTIVKNVKRKSNVPVLPKKSKCSLAKLFGFKK